MVAYERKDCDSKLIKINEDSMFLKNLLNVRCSYRISVFFLFAISAAGVVPCGGPKKSPRTSPIEQIILLVL